MPETAQKTADIRKEKYGDKYMSDEGYQSRLEHLKTWSVDHNPASRKIVCVELGLEFDKIKDAADYFGYTYSTFCSALRKGDSFGGYTWIRNDDIVRRRYHYHKDGSPNMKPIMCIETGEVFQSVKDLAPILGVRHRTANEIVQHGRERHGKHYKYIDKGEYENATRIPESKT